MRYHHGDRAEVSVTLVSGFRWEIFKKAPSQEEGDRSLGRVLGHFTVLVHLDLNGNVIGQEGEQSLMMLVQCTTLTHVILDHNLIDDWVVRALGAFRRGRNRRRHSGCCYWDRGEPALGIVPTLLPTSLFHQVRSYCCWDRGEPTLGTTQALPQSSLSLYRRSDCNWDRVESALGSAQAIPKDTTDRLHEIDSEIEMSQRWTLHQHSCKVGHCKFSSKFTEWQLECTDVVPRCHEWEMVENQLEPVCVVAPFSETDHGRQSHLLNFLFYSLRGPCQHDRPARWPSPAPVLSRHGSQNCNKDVFVGEHQWLCLCILRRFSCPLLLCSSRLLALVRCVCATHIVFLHGSSKFSDDIWGLTYASDDNSYDIPLLCCPCFPPCLFVIFPLKSEFLHTPRTYLSVVRRNLTELQSIFFILLFLPIVLFSSEVGIFFIHPLPSFRGAFLKFSTLVPI